MGLLKVQSTVSRKFSSHQNLYQIVLLKMLLVLLSRFPAPIHKLLCFTWKYLCFGRCFVDLLSGVSLQNRAFVFNQVTRVFDTQHYWCAFIIQTFPRRYSNDQLLWWPLLFVGRHTAHRVHSLKDDSTHVVSWHLFWLYYRFTFECIFGARWAPKHHHQHHHPECVFGQSSDDEDQAH